MAKTSTTKTTTKSKTTKTSTTKAKSTTKVEAPKKRRTKAEIEAEKKAKAERKEAIARKKAEIEAKRLAREQKKAEREAAIKAKADAAAAKEKEKLELEKQQKEIDALKVDTKKYCKPVPMTKAERDHIKRIMASADFRLSICTQHYGKSEFRVLNHRENEMVISVDGVYYFYNKLTDKGINFGSVFDTWLCTSKRVPWTDPEPKVNIDKQEVAQKVVITDEQKKAILRKMRGKR
jgi:hypothetical protein